MITIINVKFLKNFKWRFLSRYSVYRLFVFSDGGVLNVSFLRHTQKGRYLRPFRWIARWRSLRSLGGFATANFRLRIVFTSGLPSFVALFRVQTFRLFRRRSSQR